MYYSSFTKIVKSIALICRFAYFKEKRDCPRGLLSASEFDCAHDILVRHVLNQSYKREIDHLKAGKPSLRSSSILCLSPFLDDNGICHLQFGMHVIEYLIVSIYFVLYSCKVTLYLATGLFCP